jgi:hypothetical protein
MLLNLLTQRDVRSLCVYAHVISEQFAETAAIVARAAGPGSQPVQWTFSRMPFCTLAWFLLKE